MVPRARRVSPRQAALFALLPAILAMCACRRGGPQESEAVRALVQQEVQAINARDLNALSRVWSQSPDITLFDIAPPGRFQGWDAIGRTFNDFFGHLAEPRLTIEGLEVRVEGTVAWATYDWSITGIIDAAPLEDRGRTTSVYRREKEGWKLVHEHVSIAPAPRAAAPAVPPAAPPAKPGGAPQGG